MAVAPRLVSHIALLCLILLALARCSAAPPKRWGGLIPEKPERFVADEKTDTKKDEPEDTGPELDPEFRVESIERDLARAAEKATARKPTDRPAIRLPQVPVQRLVPEWQAIAPEGALDDEVADEAALPRYAIPVGEKPSDQDGRLPGTVAESSAEELDELYSASAHLSAGRLDRALVDLRRFLDRDPRHAYADRAERMIVQAHFDAGEWALAITAANRLATAFPGTLAAHDAVRLRTQALQKLGYPVASSAPPR